MVRCILGFEGIVLRELPFVLGRKRMRSRRDRSRRTTQDEQRVAQRFGIQSLAIKHGQPFIVRIGGRLTIITSRAEAVDSLRVHRCRATGQSISAREHDPPMHGLHGPTIVDQLIGEIIQQLRVRGRLALFAEVIGRRHKSFTKVILPKAIGQHAGW